MKTAEEYEIKIAKLQTLLDKADKVIDVADSDDNNGNVTTHLQEALDIYHAQLENKTLREYVKNTRGNPDNYYWAEEIIL